MQIRRELVNKWAILDFLQYTAARRIFHPAKGCIATHLKHILLRGKTVPGRPDLLEIVVCSYRVVRHGLRQRRQSGVKVFEGEIPDFVKEALRHEYSRTVQLPEAVMGKSVFSVGGKLVRTICRSGLKGVDVDAERCYSTLRDSAAPANLRRETLKHYLAHVADMTEWIASKCKISDKEAKLLVTAVGNGAAISESFPDDVRAWLQDFKQDNIRIMEHNALEKPALRAKFPDGFKGLLTFQAALDADAEAEEIDKIDEIGASNEYDGIYFFLEGMSAEAKLAECRAKMSVLKLNIKAYEDPLDCGKRKYPHLGWTPNKMSSVEWLDTWDQCLKYIGQPD